MRIVSRRDHQSSRDTEASLDEMQFSSPVDSSGVLKLVSEGKPSGPKDPLDMWQPRRACEFPESFRTQLETGKSPHWLTKSDSMSGHSDAGETGDVMDLYPVYPASNRTHMPPLRDGVSPHTRQSPKERYEEGYRQPLQADVSEVVSDIEPEACQAQSQGDTSPTTDGTPPVRHKRFSGWSLPSVLETGHEANSVHTDLEEMRFASPSPERVLRKLPSQSQSTTDLSSLPRPTSFP